MPVRIALPTTLRKQEIRQQETTHTQTGMFPVLIVNARPAALRTITDIVMSADTPTSTRDGWERNTANIMV